MKRFFQLLMLLSPLICFAQKPLEPCCSILTLQPPDGLVIRDNGTGRIFRVKADAFDYANLKMGDQVNADYSSNKVTQIRGISRNYQISEPDPLDPCCGIRSINVNGLTPCCSIVTITDNGTGETYTAEVNKEVAKQLKTGQAVYRLEPPDSKHYSPVDGYSPVDSYVGFNLINGSKRASYGYPMRKSTGGGTIMNQSTQDRSADKIIADLRNQLAQCQQENQKLSAASSESLDQGYESIYIEGNVGEKEEVHIKVNGKTVVSFNPTQSAKTYLDHYLIPGKTNILSFECSGAKYTRLVVNGKFRGDEGWNIFYNFSPREGKETEEIEVPFIGKKKQ